MRLVLRRAAGARTLLVAAAITATITTVLLTAYLQFAQLLPAAGVRAAVAAAPAQERSIFVTGSAGSGAPDVAKRDAVVREEFADGIAGVPLTIEAGGYAIGQRIPDGTGQTVPRSDGTYAVVTFLSGLPAHADLTAGAWPAVTPAGTPAQVALPDSVAAMLGVRVGDQIPVTDQRTKRPAPLVVAGVFTPRDPTEPYWQLGAAPLTAGAYGPVVVHQDVFLDRYSQLATVDWVATPDPEALVGGSLTRVGSAAP